MSSRTYEADQLVNHVTGTDLLSFMDGLDALPDPLGRDLRQSLMDHYKHLLHTEDDLLEALGPEPGRLVDAEGNLARRLGDWFPVLNAGAYQHPDSRAGVIWSSHDTALASFADVLAIARALHP